MEKLCPDGGIVKVVLAPAPGSAPIIPWGRGYNAKLHYTVATAPFRPLTRPMDPPAPPPAPPVVAAVHKHGRHQHKHSHGHEHGTSCTHHHDHDHDEKILCKSNPSDSKADLQQQTSPDPSAPVFASPSGVPYTFDTSVRRVIADTVRDDGLETLFELRIGRKFAFPALETAVTSMRVGETAKFLISPEYSLGFIQLESHLRRTRASANGRPVSNCCMGMAADADQHADLYSSADSPLELTVTLHEALAPAEYARDAWEVDAADRANEVSTIKDAGAAAFRRGEIGVARDQYMRALEWLESAHLKGQESRRTTDAGPESELTPPPVTDIARLCPVWAADTMRTLRLNIALCSLRLAEYERAVTQCSAVLVDSPRCTKALFRRALAHVRKGRDLDLAVTDLTAAVDPTRADTPMSRDDPEWRAAWDAYQTLSAHAVRQEKSMWGKLFGS
ncbi:hypothetical protein BC828DRAFT_379856 [Blastocladiella britannica]|nr:hypothetical protein BC828DRAFT_379856 [Blastocladiella britannica]